MNKEQQQLVNTLMSKGQHISLALQNGENLIDITKSKKAGYVLESHSSAMLKLSDIPHNWVYLKGSFESYHSIFHVTGIPNIIIRELALSSSPILLSIIPPESVKPGDLVYIKEVPLVDIEPDIKLPTFTKSSYHFLRNGLFTVVYKGVKKDIPEVYKSKTTQVLVNDDITDYEYVIVVSIGPTDYILALEHIHKHGFYPIKTIQ